jgi:hypothetical protein
VLYSAFVPEKGVPLLDDVPPGHAALLRQLASESPDNSVVQPYPVWQSGFVKETPELCKGWSTKSSCRNRCPVDSRDEPDTRHRAEPAVTDDAKSQAKRWTRLRRGAARGGAHGCDFALSGYK